MSVFETVAEIVEFIATTDPYPVQGEWANERSEPVAWIDENGSGRLFVARREWTRAHSPKEWASHPAAYLLREEPRSPMESGPRCDIALALWVLEDGAHEAAVAAGLDATYARAARKCGLNDAASIIGAWTSGIPLEYLGALS